MSVRQVPENVDGFDEGFGSFGRGKQDPPSAGFFRDQTRLVQAVQMFDGGRLVDAAFDGDFIDAERSATQEKPDNLNPAVIGQTGDHARLSAFPSCHERQHMDLLP
jgi:hypothetical protein